MDISSRTPEGQHNQCPLCGKPVVIEPSQPPGDAPCPHCGYLLWFGVDSSDFVDPSGRSSERDIVTNLLEHAIPRNVLALIPESVARENNLIPFAMKDNTICIASAILTGDMIEKLRFISDRDVRLLPANPRAIHQAIDKHYA